MITDYTLNRRHANYRAWRTYHSLTHPVLLSVAVLAVLCLFSSISWYIFMPTASWVLGSMFVSASATSALWLFILFAITYFPGRFQEPQAADLTACASFELLQLLTRHTDQTGKINLPQALQEFQRSSRAREFVARLQLPVESFKAMVAQVSTTAVAQTILTQSFTLAKHNGGEVTISHLLAALLMQTETQAWLRTFDLQATDIAFTSWWVDYLFNMKKEQRRWWTAQRLTAIGGIGQDWSAGYTRLANQLNRIPKGNIWDRFSYGRAEQVEQLITTLARQQQSNVLLVGQPGVGRLGIVRQVATRVRTGQAHPAINGYRLVYLHVGELLAQAQSSAAQLSTISRVLTELERAGNVIVVIDGIGSILAADGEQRLNLTEVLLPFFSSLTVKVVVILSAEEYHLRLQTNEELIRYFEVIQVPSLDAEATKRVVALAAPLLERSSHLRLPYATMQAIVEHTDGIMQHIPFPERAFDVLEEAVVMAQTQRLADIPRELIEQLVSKKAGIPIGRLQQQEKQQLLNLEEIMHQRLVNQRHAVQAVARAMIRARAGVRNRERPIGSFLFLGPTGVGKTETAKTLAEAYFGSENYLTRLDMSEYQHERGLEILLGSGQQPVGRLTSLMHERPFTVLLLDEFEKAHSSVQRLFLQVIDEGRLTDARGQLASFRHTIIIATSNAGAEYIRQQVSAGPLPPDFDTQLRNVILEQHIFPPELLNRFDGLITFTPLSPEHIEQIAILLLKKLNRRLDAEQGITVAITPELVQYLVRVGYDPEFGARPMNRAIQDTVEYVIARRVIAGQVKPGQQVVLHPSELAV